MERLEGRNWFSRSPIRNSRSRWHRRSCGQLAELHRLDPRDLACPSSGVPDRVSRTSSTRSTFGMSSIAVKVSPTVAVLALSWLAVIFRRRRLAGGAGAGRHRAGNFMYRDSEIVAVTDWEMAHLGDLHDDLGWNLRP